MLEEYGIKTEGKSRPIKVVFNTEKEKRNLFGNLKALIKELGSTKELAFLTYKHNIRAANEI